MGVGIALLFSFIALGIIGEALAGSLVPLFIGLGLIIYYAVRRKIAGDEKLNGEPVTFSPSKGGTDASVRVMSGNDE